MLPPSRRQWLCSRDSAENLQPKSSQNNHLSPVADTPSFAISRTPGFGYPLREGIEVSLKCDVDSNPPSTPRWQKDDGDTPVSWELVH